MAIVLNISEATELLNLTSVLDLTDADKADKLVIAILKLNIFIMKKVASGSNSVALVPSLKKKLDELWFDYLEEIQNEMEQGIVNEGQYLERSTSSVKERANMLELLDLLELGVVTKCVII